MRFDFRSPEFYSWFDDFDGAMFGDWVVTATEAGSGDASESVQDADLGVLLLTPDAADDDNVFLQSSSEIFKFVSGKRLYFGCRFKVADAVESDFILGLQIRDVSPLSVTDGIFFQKDDGDALLDLHSKKNSTADDATGIKTLVNDTWYVVEFYYDGTDKIHAFVDGVEVGYVPTTNAVDDEELAISIGIQNGAAAAKTMSIDWVRVVRER